MKCPKCDEGLLQQITLKKTQAMGFLCEMCGTIWFDGESIQAYTGHQIRAYIPDEDIEYSLEEHYEEDGDAQPIAFSKIK
jgi:uncharacterized Zn finger protein